MAWLALPILAGCGGEPIRNLGCDGPPAVEEGLRAAEGLRDRCFLDEACWESGLAEARALRDRFPEELAAHRAYVLSRFRGRHGESGASGQAVAEEYRGRLERQPDDAGLLYLNALLTENRVERRELLRQSIARADTFPWPRYALALEHGWNPDVEERAAARAEGARFVAACPDRLGEIQRLAGALDDAALFDRYRDRFVEGFEPARERFSRARDALASDVPVREARPAPGDPRRGGDGAGEGGGPRARQRPHLAARARSRLPHDGRQRR